MAQDSTSEHCNSEDRGFDTRVTREHISFTPNIGQVFKTYCINPFPRPWKEGAATFLCRNEMKNLSLATARHIQGFVHINTIFFAIDLLQ